MDQIKKLLQNAQIQLDYCEECIEPHSAYRGALHIAIQNCIEAIKMLTIQQETDRPLIREKLLHSWPVCDEYGWRMISLMKQGEKLVLYAYNKNGDEVDPNL